MNCDFCDKLYLAEPPATEPRHALAMFSALERVLERNIKIIK